MRLDIGDAHLGQRGLDRALQSVSSHRQRTQLFEEELDDDEPPLDALEALELEDAPPPVALPPEPELPPLEAPPDALPPDDAPPDALPPDSALACFLYSAER